MSEKLVYSFGTGKADGGADMKALLGGKGAGLAEMTNLGIPVPPGFTITTEVCAHFTRDGGYPPDLGRQVNEALARVQAIIGARFGEPAAPLLVSVRSGARASMPGMMDTILNLGLNERTVVALAAATGNPRFAWDSYRRFVQMYGSIVLGAPRGRMEEMLAESKRAAGVHLDTELSEGDLRALTSSLKAFVAERAGRPFPDDPAEQLWGAIGAVFRSWMNPRAVTYRQLYGIPATWGTAVNVQAMVFGNLGDDSATGVAFTRDPATGEDRLFGEFLVNAQGEDVVAGIRTPLPLAELESRFPEAYRQLMEIRARLERRFCDMQDIEFTIQKGRLWMLQTRTGKRSARAMVRIAVELCRSGAIDEAAAVLRADPDKVQELFFPEIEPCPAEEAVTTGLAASAGAGVGRAVFTADDARAWADRGEKVVLVREETSPDDLHGMKAAEGILTARGGLTSHAAVVARGMGKCCVVGAGAIDVDSTRGEFRVGGTVVRRGDWISVCGKHGRVFLGKRTVQMPELPAEFHTLMEWADARARLRVRTNADTPEDARVARAFGARGIGLCRTEHMFFNPERILAVREMLLAEDETGRRAALAKILPMQRGDFVEIFRIMDGLPVTIRLLDPPLHEFLPKTDRDIEELLRATGADAARLRRRNEDLHEANPMLGHRGCRIGLTYPEVYEVQVRAIMEAACELLPAGIRVIPEIMIPLVAHEEELKRMRELCVAEAERVFAERGTMLPYTVGTMIELPRACLVADRIAEHADFFSYGTNDLTQTTFGLSRDDAGRFLPFYVEKGVFSRDPFVAIDVDGLGQLMRIGVEKGRARKRDLKIGICGEHGGEPSSVAFCHGLGLDYVSCSPFRVPVARLAAAHAALLESRGAEAGSV
jgi:pyruvate, orthophosphate dikinase